MKSFVRSCVFVLGVVLISVAARAETVVTVGFPQFPRDLNVLESQHPAAIFLRRAVTSGLVDWVFAGSGSSTRLALGNQLTTSADGKSWRFRISPLARFSSGAAVHGRDVDYSLRRCREHGVIPDLVAVRFSEALSSAEDGAEWVELQFRPEAQTSQSALLEQLADCPVVERSSSLVFSQELGKGTNILAAGPFEFSSYRAGREITLRRRHGHESRSSAGVGVLAVRGFSEAHAGLAAIRAGTIDAFYTLDQEVINKAKKDETLFALECPIYTAIIRSGLKIGCADKVLPSEIHYLG